MRHIIGLLLLGFYFPSTLPAADPPKIATGFDLIPINAAAGFAVHNLDELQAQGEVFIKNAGVEQEFGIRPSQLLEFAFGFLGVTRGRDDTKPAGIFLANLIESRVLNPSGFQELEKLLVVAVGIADRKAMAGNFGLSEKELHDEQIVRIRKKNGSFGQLVYVRGQHLYLGNHDRAILSVAHGKSLSEALTKTQLARVSRSDMLLHFGTTAWGAGWVVLVQEAQERAKKLEGQETDPETGLSTQMLKLIADSLPAVQNMLFSVAIDELGFEFNSLSVFRTEDHPQARKLLELLRSGEQASTVATLPKQQLIASQAVRSDGTQNRALVRALLELSLNVWFGQKKLLAVVEQPQFVGLFDEVWQRLQGSQLAVYRNPDPATQGLFSMLAVLDTEDPDEFLQEMRELARFAKPGELKLDGDNKQADDVATVEKLIQELGDPNFRVRQSATL